MQVIIAKNKGDLERLETVIRVNIGAFYDVGLALMEIRDKRLYKDVLGFETFEAYCKARWDFSRQRAYQLIESVTVKNNLSTGVDIQLTEYQIRPLARLEPEQQREAWAKAVETAPDGKITAAHVSKVVNQITRNIIQGKEKAVLKKARVIEKIDPEFEKSWDGLFVAIKNLKALKWKGMTRECAIRQVQILIDILEV
jgi:hypothetical protein